MPIKGISELVRLPRLGKIHLGIKVQRPDGVTYPKATDYFVCPEEVKAVYGEQPKELKILFPTEDEGQWAQQWLKCYSSSRGLVCRGDGAIATARVDVHTGEIAAHAAVDTEMREVTCDPEKCPMYAIRHCRRIMTLQFLLPDCPGFGVWQIDTTSFFSILNINSNIQLIRGICGRIGMLPLTLKLVPQEVAPDGKKKKVNVLNVSIEFTLRELQQFAQIPAARILLPAPDIERPDDLFPSTSEEDAPPVEDTPPSSDDSGFGDLKSASTKSKIDPTWLQELPLQLVKAHWTEKTAISWCVAKFKIPGRQTLAETLESLLVEQRNAFVKEIDSRIEAAG